VETAVVQGVPAITAVINLITWRRDLCQSHQPYFRYIGYNTGHFSSVIGIYFFDTGVVFMQQIERSAS